MVLHNVSYCCDQERRSQVKVEWRGEEIESVASPDSEGQITLSVVSSLPVIPRLRGVLHTLLFSSHFEMYYKFVLPTVYSLIFRFFDRSVK